MLGWSSPETKTLREFGREEESSADFADSRRLFLSFESAESGPWESVDKEVFINKKSHAREKRVAEKSYFGPRSLRRNYPHQVQGVRPGRLSRVGSPAVSLTLGRNSKVESGKSAARNIALRFPDAASLPRFQPDEWLGLLGRGRFLFHVRVEDRQPIVPFFFPDGAAVEGAGMILAIICAFNLDDVSRHNHISFI